MNASYAGCVRQASALHCLINSGTRVYSTDLFSVGQSFRLPNGRGQRSFERPFRLENAEVERLGFDAEFSRPFGYCFSLASELDIEIASCLVHLFPNSGPADIGSPSVCETFGTLAAGVSFIIVDPVKAMPWARTFAHIGNEVLVGVAPAIANPNRIFRPSSIGLVPFAFWVVTSLDHISPSTIFGLRLADAMVPMSYPRLWEFLSPATTRDRTSVQKMSGGNNGLRSAITTAKPQSAASFVVADPANDDQSAKAPSGQVLEVWMPSCRMVLSHDMPSCSGCVVGQGHASVPALSRPASFYSSKLKMVA